MDLTQWGYRPSFQARFDALARGQVVYQAGIYQTQHVIVQGSLTLLQTIGHPFARQIVAFLAIVLFQVATKTRNVTQDRFDDAAIFRVFLWIDHDWVLHGKGDGRDLL